MHIAGPMMYAGKDQDGFAVYLFCGPLRPTTFRIPSAPRSNA